MTLVRYRTTIIGIVFDLMASAAVNFIIPFLMILGAIGFMFGTGGSALIAIKMGEGDIGMVFIRQVAEFHSRLE